MQYRCVVLFLFSTLCLGQISEAGKQKPTGKTDGGDASSPSAASEVAPNAAVITIVGLCDNTASATGTTASAPKNSLGPAQASAPVTGANCKATITRAQFEGVVDAINPKANIGQRHRFAKEYAELLLFDHKARQLGLDKDPDFQQYLQFKHSQALEVVLTNYLQSQANEISDAAVAEYYKEHPERFEEIALQRIFVPVRESAEVRADPDNAPDEASAADRVAMQQTAEKIQREATAGGDFEKLEAEAYKAAQVTVEVPPDVDLGDKWTIDNLPPEHKDRITHMKPGEVSALVVHPLGWQIFKVTSTHMIPLSEAKPVLQSLRMKDAMQALKSSIDAQLNQAYFADPADQQPGHPSSQEIMK
ncbi:MAG: peptidylprolyl isomerase [Terriglobales bacterium]